MKKIYTLAAMLVAAASFGFSANAQDEPVTVEDYKSDMTDWTFTKVSGTQNWMIWSEAAEDGDMTETMTGAEKAKTGCNDGISIEFSPTDDIDAWAISPAVKLDAGVKYNVSFYIKAWQSDASENFKLNVANSNTVDALSTGTELVEKTDFNTYILTEITAEFTPEESGDYYFGLNCFTGADEYGLAATGFSVSHEQTSGVEAVIADSEAKAEYFDLQGRRVEEPKAGLYICRKGNIVTKAVVK